MQNRFIYVIYCKKNKSFKYIYTCDFNGRKLFLAVFVTYQSETCLQTFGNPVIYVYTRPFILPSTFGIFPYRYSLLCHSASGSGWGLFDSNGRPHKLNLFPQAVLWLLIYIYIQLQTFCIYTYNLLNVFLIKILIQV